ncbi:MAG: pyridoxal-phosphate dependent enzyme [Thermotaleaceae bacterium]
MSRINDKLRGAYCIRCNSSFRLDDYLEGCPTCKTQGFPSSMSLVYEEKQHIHTEAKRMKRYIDFLPYAEFPTLGEGGTPLVPSKRLGEQLNIGNLYFKNEFQNPTGSHKDRMSGFIVARALDLKKQIVTAASSGNAGVSLATYAASVGLPCKIVTTVKMNPIWKRAIEMTGAEIIFTNRPEERWPYVQEMVEKEGWYPATNYASPPVGSNLFGVQGYKTVAYEICEDLNGERLDWVVIPTCRGDLLWGIYEGFKDMIKQNIIPQMPKLVAVEPFPRIERVLEGEDYRSLFPGSAAETSSIGGGTVSYQAVKAIEASKGVAVHVKADEVFENIKELSHNGFYLESSSAVAIGALKQLLDNKRIQAEDNVVIVATSSGYKDVPKL